MKNKHPDQPVVKGYFKHNSIVRWLKDQHSLNTLASIPFPQEDWDQFMQLIGYSTGGYEESCLVSAKAKKRLVK